MKNTQWKPMVRLLALILVLSFSICQIPVGAVSITAADSTTDVTVAEPPSADAVIVTEDTSKREENVKHFRLSDGTYRAVQYDVPVHFMQDNEWVDYDNTLVETVSEEVGNPDLVNTSADYEVRLSKKTNGKKWVRLEKDGYKISWYYLNGSKSTGVVEMATDDGDLTTLEKAASSVTYADVFDGVDLRYRIGPDGLKEDIILKENGTQTVFTAEYNIDKLVAVQTDAQTIELRDADGAVVYTLSAPYMTDAKGAISNALTYKIIDQKSKRITVELTADDDWLNDQSREFPVTVDPSIKTDTEDTGAYRVTGTYISSANEKSQGTVPTIYVGKGSDGFYYKSILTLNPLIPLEDNAVVVSAKLNLAIRLSTAVVKTTVEQIVSPWTFDQLTWENLPTCEENRVLDVKSVMQIDEMWPIENRRMSWDITGAVRNWYKNPNNNYGVMLSGINSVDVGMISLIYSSSYEGDTSARPTIEIDYRNTSGLEEYWKYVGSDAGRNGSAATNVFNGNLVVSQPVTVSAGGNVMPVLFNLTYNSNNLQNDTTASYIGRGWRMNYQLTVSKEDVNHDGVFDYYNYTDSDGTVHAFPITSDTTEYNDEDGLGFTLTQSGGGYTIKDRDDNSIVFNNQGFATAITNALGKSIELRYSMVNGAHRLEKVIDGANREYTLSYDSSFPLRVNSIADPANRVTSFSYGSIGQLLTITFPDGKSVVMTYADTGATTNSAEKHHFRLLTVTGNDGGTLEVTYSPNEMYRTEKMTRKYGETVRADVEFEYNLNQTKVTDDDGHNFFYQFDYHGQTTGVISDAEGLGLFYEYEDRNENHLKANKVSKESRVQKTIVNLLPNFGFDTTYSPFYKIWSGTSDNELSYDATKGRTASGSLKVSRTGTLAESGDYAFFAYYFDAPKSGYYTFSGYANTEGQTIAGHGAEIRLERWSSGHGTALGGNGASINKTEAGEWEHGSVTMYFDKGDTIKCLVGIEDEIGVGTAWFDDLQLEYGEVVNSHNLLRNSDFTNGGAGWEIPTGINVTYPPESLLDVASRVVTIPGNAWENRCVSQTVRVSDGKAGDIYSVGTWAAAFSIPTTKNDLGEYSRAFSIYAEFYWGNTRVGLARRIQCATHMPYAQMVSGELIAPADYTNIKISLEYNYNANEAYFALPYLYRENYGVKYNYDENGQPIGSVGQDETEFSYGYNENYQLTKLVNPSESSIQYHYDDYNQLTAVFSSDGLRTDHTYDTYGNNTETILSADESGPLVDNAFYYLVNCETEESPQTESSETVPLTEFDITDLSQKWRFDQQGDDVYRLYSAAAEENNESRTLNTYASNHSSYGLLHLLSANSDNTSLFKFVKQDDGNYVILTAESNYTKCVIADARGEDDVLMTAAYNAANVTKAQKWKVVPLDPTQVAYIKTLAQYTGNGNFLVSETDAFNNQSIYDYNQSNGLLRSVTDAEGVVTSYTYNELNGSIKTVTVDGKTVSYSYDAADRLDTITTANGVRYHFVYDVFGRITAIEIVDANGTNTHTLCTRVYHENTDLLYEQRYANGDVYRYTYDNLDRRIGVYCNGEQQHAYFYNAVGDVAAAADFPGRKLVRTMFDAEGRVTEEKTHTFVGNVGITDMLKKTTVSYRSVYGYDEKTGYLFEETQETPIGTTDYTYTYGNFEAGEMPDTVYTVESSPSYSGKSEKVTYAYDSLGRLSTRTVYLDVANDVKKVTTYTYKAGGHGANSTSTQIDTVTTDGITYQYTYDKMGRIEQITKNGTEVENYVYDSLGQLTQVRNGDTIIAEYTYDNGGNITSSTVNGVTHTYTYGNSMWKDQLTAFDGKTITYDEVGNPLKYYDGTNMTWGNGRRLSYYINDHVGVLFSYAADGTRTQKLANGVTKLYYYAEGRLYGERTSSSNLVYLYDDTDSPYGYIYNGTTYYYERNVQGDVIGLYDSSGAKIASYTYDAWGNITSILDASGADISNQPSHQANINPIRYRGYYYDVETGFYYVSSRYYDPEIGRWINADNQIAGVGGEVLGYNMFAYCMNNPVNMSDPSGNWPRWATIALGAVAAVAAVAVTVVTLGAAAPAAACTLTAVGMSIGASYAVASTAATVAVVATTVAAAAYAGDIAYSAVTGDSLLLDTVFQGNTNAYNTGLAITSVATAGMLEAAAQSPGVCFVAGTPVLAACGYIAIEAIKAGDMVWAENPETGEKELKEVVQTFVNETTELIYIQVGSEEIVTTPEHPFYSPVKGWIAACKLRVGDILVLQNGKYVTVEKVQHEILEAPITVYNFEVEDFHTYYVGKCAVLVHNTCGGNSSSRGVGGKGWVGDKTWRENVSTVGNGGTITSLNGGVPTKAQAMQLINQSGGTPLRIEGAHQFPNPHNYTHINYVTSSGVKGTIKIFE